MNASHLHKVGIGPVIVHDLRGKAADVDGVGARQAHALACKQLIAADGGEDLLHARLRIVKVAAHRAHTDIVALLRGHLRLLHGAHAAVGIENDNLRARHIAKALHRGLAGVAGCGGQNEDLIAYAALFLRRGHQSRQHGERHIFKSARRPAEQLENKVFSDGNARREVIALKLSPVACAHERGHLLLGKVRQKLCKDPGRHGKGVEVQNLAVVETGLVERRHRIKAAVGRKAVQNGLRAAGLQIFIAGALILHGRFLLYPTGKVFLLPLLYFHKRYVILFPSKSQVFFSQRHFRHKLQIRPHLTEYPPKRKKVFPRENCTFGLRHCWLPFL